MVEFYATLTGDKEIIAEFNKLGTSLSASRKVEDGLFETAKELWNRIKKATPKSKSSALVSASRHPTKSGLPSIYDDPGYAEFLGKTNKGGNLKKSIVAKRYKRQQPGNPAVFVGIDYRFGPHAWWVEHGAARGQPAVAGTFRKKPSGRKALHFTWRGVEWFLSQSAPGPMPARPFFRPTVDANQSEMIERIGVSISDAIDWYVKNYNYLRYQGKL